MCGIIGIVSSAQAVADRIINSIARLEYRGYDSAGVGTIDGMFHIVKTAGKVAQLKEQFDQKPITGTIGIGHTRWATHGIPSYVNAHPIHTDKVMIVHNGIIENYQEIKGELTEFKFEGETDTEVLVKLIHHYLDNYTFIEALRMVLTRCKGMYTFLAMDISSHKLYGVKNGLPLAIGIGDGEMYFGSDAFALSILTDKLIYLNDREIAILESHNYTVEDVEGNLLDKQVKTISVEDTADKQNYDHFMLKEIHEQPQVLARCFAKYYSTQNKTLDFTNVDIDWSTVNNINIIACGSSYYCAKVGAYWIEDKARIGVKVDLASEFRYRNPVLNQGDICIFISQSGETADTLSALKFVKSKNIPIIAITNVIESSIANEADFILPIYANSEVGVASTKTFTATLMVLALLTLDVASSVNELSEFELNDIVSSLENISFRISTILDLTSDLNKVVKNIQDIKSMLYIGRGLSYPIAMEGALKFKELCYIPTEGIAGGELKHGTIALIDSQTLICILAPSDQMLTKISSNLQEIHARGGKIILFGDHASINQLKDFCFTTIELPICNEFITPIVYSVAMQLTAYNFALSKGFDIDQPRNLAKSVTVE